MYALIPVALSLVLAQAAPEQSSIEGRWTNPDHSVIVDIAPCEAALCGTVQWATQQAQQDARKGTPTLIGTQILSDVQSDGNGVFKGRAFDPKRNLRAPATIRLIGSNTLVVKGCVLGGFICKEQRWSRVG